MSSRLPANAAAPDVAVVVTTFNHAHFLVDALRSVLGQSHPASEVVVVDDGSADDPSAVVARFPGVKLMRQHNQGLSAARNAGLAAVRSPKVVFLDADDVLLPDAVATGLACFAEHTDCGFVYGGYRQINQHGRRITEREYNPIGPDPYRDLLRGNLIGMHATVMYDRERLLGIGAFDTSLRRCEDYDVYLRMAKAGRVASHPFVIAEYRWHGANMSSNPREMLEWALLVHARHAEHAFALAGGAADWQHGRRGWRRYYAGEMLGATRRRWAMKPSMPATVKGVVQAVVTSPSTTLQALAQTARNRWHRWFPDRSAPGRRPNGAFRFGDLGGTQPVSDEFGYDRGTPIDRFYIEGFLRTHAHDIAGHVLEVGDDTYCRRFGAERVTRQEVLHIQQRPGVTLVGDLSQPGTLPTGALDCLVLTQTLHLIFDLRAAVAQMHRSLRSGGVLLLTVPGISRIDRGEWGAQWYWSLTAASATRLFEEVFGADNVQVESCGNVFAATTFLQGLAVEEVETAKLEVRDACFPVVVTVRARKAVVS